MGVSDVGLLKSVCNDRQLKRLRNRGKGYYKGLFAALGKFILYFETNKILRGIYK